MPFPAWYLDFKAERPIPVRLFTMEGDTRTFPSVIKALCRAGHGDVVWDECSDLMIEVEVLDPETNGYVWDDASCSLKTCVVGCKEIRWKER